MIAIHEFSEAETEAANKKMAEALLRILAAMKAECETMPSPSPHASKDDVTWGWMMSMTTNIGALLLLEAGAAKGLPLDSGYRVFVALLASAAETHTGTELLRRTREVLGTSKKGMH